MNEHELKLFELLLAEIFKNKIVLDEIIEEAENSLLDITAGENLMIGEYEKGNGKSFEYGPILFDESKLQPSAIRENVLERKNDKRNKRR